MQEKKMRAAKNIITLSVILSLLWNVYLSVDMMSAYSNQHNNLLRIHQGGSDLPLFITVLFIDTVVSILWISKPKLFKIHRIVYISGSWLFYNIMLFEKEALSGLGAIFVIFTTVPFLYLVGIIPFIVGSIGYGKLEKARIDS